MPQMMTQELPVSSAPMVLQGMAQALPLRGLTILAVEDSRYASEALRLMCQRLGARLRRAETLMAAKSHLRLYRPDVVLVDLGLPDGRGEGLIREMVLRTPRHHVVLGMSGDAAGRASALSAGADGFVEKPLESLSSFLATLVHHLPQQAVAGGLAFAGSGLAPLDYGTADAAAEVPLRPDRLALRDDLSHAAEVIAAGPTEETQRYLAAFMGGVARHAHDPDLAAAADEARGGRLDPLQRLIASRLDHGDGFLGADR